MDAKQVQERCYVCDDLTGRAGKTEDSLYCCDSGPYCEECFHEHLKTEHRCPGCGGHGEIKVFRDGQNRVDYLHGQWRGEITRCSTCQGEGYRI